MVKNPPASAGDIRDTGSVLGSERTPGGGHGNPLVFFPGESLGQRSLTGHSPRGCKELDTAEATYVCMHVGHISEVPENLCESPC